MIPRILIVDDDASIRNSIKEFLSLHGFKITTASCAEDAIELLKTHAIDVAITDIILKNMDGLELTAFIKENYDSDVIVITGYSNDHSYEDAVNKGASDFVFKPFRFEELLLRLKRVVRERQSTKERVNMLEQLKKLAITDGLTQLYNSRYFYTQLESEVERFDRYSHPLSLLLLDIDKFKGYNDKYGHLGGDKVLVKFGQLIKSCLRKMDTAYRYGGEEFTVVLPETSYSEAMLVAERIKKAIEMEGFTPGTKKPVSLTVSIGVTEYGPDEKISTFVQRADKAMYLSKENGRNMVSSLLPTGS